MASIHSTDLALCVADVNTHHPDAAFAILTGDLAHKGEPAAYEALKRELDKLVIPYHLLVGNHDDRANLRAAFPDARGRQRVRPIHLRCRRRRAGRLSRHQRARQALGTFCETRAAWLEDVLAKRGDRPVIIFMHHPPFKVRLKRMDDISCWNRASSSRRSPGTRTSGTCSSGTFTGRWREAGAASRSRPACDQPPGGPRFRGRGRIMGSHEPPAYGVVLLEQDQMIVHMHDYLDRTEYLPA